jgi:hypothetical protein
MTGIPGISKSYDIDGHIGGIYQVYTTNSNFLGLPDVVQIMYITRTCLACTISRFYESKNLLRLGLEPTILCVPSSCLYHCATSNDVIVAIVTVYVYCFTWRLVTYVRRWTSSAPRPRHDVAGQSINMDLSSINMDLCPVADQGRPGTVGSSR